MASSGDVLISVEGRHAINMTRGKKTVEFRRRAIRVPPGCRVWIYSKIPHGSLEVFGIVSGTLEAPPGELWRLYGQQGAITRSEFESYFGGVGIGCAIQFQEIHCLRPALRLKDIRAKHASFHPPQFFKWLSANSPELAIFLSAISSEVGASTYF